MHLNLNRFRISQIVTHDFVMKYNYELVISMATISPFL